MGRASYSVEAFRRRAAARLPRFVSDFIDGGVLGEHALDANTTAASGVEASGEGNGDLLELAR